MYNLERTRKLKKVIIGVIVALIVLFILIGRHFGAMIYALIAVVPLVFIYIVIEVIQRDVEEALQSLYKNK